jgi:hypothetical protein
MGIVSSMLDAQGKIEPGTQGYWSVWGACVSDIQAGDLVMTKSADGYDEFQVTEVLPEPGLTGIRFMIAGSDKVQRIGYLCPVAIARKGTHHILSPRAR